MLYVSDLIGKPIADLDGKQLGKLKDLIATGRGETAHPQIVALEVKHGSGSLLISISDVAVLISLVIPLKKKKSELIPYRLDEYDLHLVRDVLDKQIIDTNGKRVVRVNDLELTRVNGSVYVANVDISGTALLRRLGFSSFANRLVERQKPGKQLSSISWDDIELLSADQPMRLKVSSDKIAELHPADLAEILSDLTRQEGEKFLDTLDLKTLADTLEEVEPDFQASLIEQMPDERLADVLEEMAPDEAADLLAELPEDRSRELLELMEDDEAQDVRRLLNYPEDSAGGIMNTEFITVSSSMTAAQVLEYLRNKADEAETIYYIYAVDRENCLAGVFSLRELVLSQPDTPVSQIMEDRLVTVGVAESQENCAHMIAKYNLLALPVVDERGWLQGIVTADDALDKIIPTAWKKRLPRMYH